MFLNGFRLYECGCYVPCFCLVANASSVELVRCDLTKTLAYRRVFVDFNTKKIGPFVFFFLYRKFNGVYR